MLCAASLTPNSDKSLQKNWKFAGMLSKAVNAKMHQKYFNNAFERCQSKISLRNSGKIRSKSANPAICGFCHAAYHRVRVISHPLSVMFAGFPAQTSAAGLAPRGSVRCKLLCPDGRGLIWKHPYYSHTIVRIGKLQHLLPNAGGGVGYTWPHIRALFVNLSFLIFFFLSVGDFSARQENYWESPVCCSDISENTFLPYDLS